MTSIQTNPAYSAAIAHLAALRTAEGAARQDEAATLDALAQLTERPESALAAAARLLKGEPAPGVDCTAQAARLADARQRLRLLGAAIAEQEAVVSGVRGELSAAACAAALPSHLEAAAGIAEALRGLRDALAAEVAVRAGITTAGYACNLQPLALHELDFDDAQSHGNRLLRDVELFLKVAKLRGTKTATVLLLRSVGIGAAGDVCRVDGPAAASLVAAGAAEETDRRPGRVHHRAEPAETIFS